MAAFRAWTPSAADTVTGTANFQQILVGFPTMPSAAAGNLVHRSIEQDYVKTQAVGNAHGNVTWNNRTTRALLDIVDDTSGHEPYTFYEIKHVLNSVGGSADVRYYESLTGYTPGTGYQSREWVLGSVPGLKH